MFLFLYRCNGMDLVTDKNRFAKSVSKPFLKRSASFGSYWEACQPTLHTGPTLPEYQWILSRIGPGWQERVQLKRIVSPSLNLVSLLRQREIYFGIFRNTNDKKLFRRSIILDEVILFGGGWVGAVFFSIKIQSIIALLNADNIFTITITSF